MGGCCLEGCFRFAPDTELEVGSKEGRSLDEGDRGGHGPKMGRSVIREKEEEEMWD
jgi:hypothetical protein